MFKTFVYVYLDLLSGKEPAANQEFATFQPQLDLEFKFENSDYYQGVPQAVDKAMFRLLGFLLYRTFQRAYGANHPITHQDLAAGREWADFLGPQPIYGLKSLFFKLIHRNLRNWYERHWFSAAAQEEDIVARGMAVAAAYRIAYRDAHFVNIDKDQSVFPPPMSAAESTSDDEKTRDSAVSKGEEVEHSQTPSCTNQLVELIQKHTQPGCIEERDLAQLEYEVVKIPIRIHGAYNVPFLDVYQLLDGKTATDSGKCLLHEYFTITDSLVNIPFGQLADVYYASNTTVPNSPRGTDTREAQATESDGR